MRFYRNIQGIWIAGADLSVSQKDCWDRYGLIGHATSFDTPITFDEIVTDVNKYCDQEEEPRIPEAEIALGLIRLVEQDLVGIRL